MKRLSAFLLLSILAVPALFAAQTAQGSIPVTLEITGVNAADAPDVTLTVNVTDAVGQTVSGLTAENFELSGSLSNVATIVSAERVSDNLPFAVVLVIDTSSSMSGTPLARTQAAAKAFVESLSADDAVALVTFDNDPAVLRDFTTDKADILAAIDRLVPRGQTALYDGAVTGIETAANAPYPRRAVILLSDGAEYGGASVAGRADAPALSPVRGVPVYTIGLGFGLDRTFLSELANASSARFYESPTPEDLAGIYGELSDLFRSQYVLTLNFTGPLDGKIYPFTLRAANPMGQSSVDAATLRAPVPTPIIRISPEPSAALATPVTFTANVLADQDVTQVEFDIAGRNVIDTEAPYTFDFDPFTTAPGEYTLIVRATDIDGDTGELSLPVSVSAIPSRITVDTDLAALGTIVTPVEVSISAESQTAPQFVDMRIDGISIGTADSLPATFVIDPFTLSPGPHSVEFVVVDVTGAAVQDAQTAVIGALPPQITVDTAALPELLLEPAAIVVDAVGQTPIETVEFTLNGVVERVSGAPAEFVIDPAALAPGEQTITVIVTDQSGTSGATLVPVNIGVLPMTLSVEGLEEGDVLDGPRTIEVIFGGQTSDGTVSLAIDSVTAQTKQAAPFEFTINPAEFGTSGAHTIAFEAANSFGASASIQFSVTVDDSVFPTPTPNSQQTADAVMTVEAGGTASALATSEAQATANAISTRDTEAALVAQATQDAQSTVDARSTVSAQATASAAAIITQTSRADRLATTEARATEQVQATIDAQFTAIAEQTLSAIETVSSQATMDTTSAAQTQQAVTEAAQTETARRAAQTAVARETAEAQLTEDAQGRATTQAEMALARESTADAASTRDASTAVAATEQAASAQTAVAQAELTMAALTDAAPSATETPIPPTQTPEPAATETPEAEPTAEATEVQPTQEQFDPTSTPGEPIDVVAPGGDAPDSQLALLAVAAGIILLFIIVALISIARRNRK